MTLKVNINLLQDNNGVAGELITQDRISVNDSFFVELEVKDVRENAAGIIGLALDVKWDASVLEALDTEITNKLPFNPQGTIDNESGAINALGAGAIPSFNQGSAIGINEPERFALLHFRGEIATDNSIPLTISISNPGSVAFADGMPFNGKADIEVQTIEVISSVENIDNAPVVNQEIADINVNENAEDRTIDLSNVFDHIDGDEITLAVKNNSNETLVATTLDGNSLTLDFLDEQFGSAAITIEATANGKTIEDTFTVDVEAMEERQLPSLDITEVHRFYQYQKGSHFYTADDNESNFIKSESETGNLQYNYEGESFAALSSNTDTLTGEAIEGVEEVYRFFNTETGAHLYTMNEVEKEYIQENFTNYNFEGIKYYAFEIEPENVETVPVYRMLNTQSGAHLFSSDLNEIGYIEENLPHFAMENNGDAVFHVLEL